MKHKTHILPEKLSRRESQSGNIFFLLFASVALVGAFAVGSSNIMKGIVTSMSETTRKTVAEERMMGGARLAIQESTRTGPSFGQCDTDTGFNFVEPLPTRDPGSLPAPIGGGLIPSDIGASTADPWGTQYGYCAWNLGDGTCVDSTRRLAGGTATTDVVVAVISAGKDRRFSTTCNAYPTATPVSRAVGSDDIVLTYTYDDATGLGGEDLWKVKDTAPDTASIDKNIDVTGSGAFTGAINLMQKGLILPADPGDNSVTGACDATTDQQLRVNTSSSPLTLEICDFAGSGWTPISVGGTSGGIPPGTLAWFKFDEGSGSTTTDTISAYAGTMTGFTSGDWVTGKNGTALRFNGTTSSIDFGSPAALDNLNAYSLCMWVQPDTTGMSGTLPALISKANPGATEQGTEHAIYMGQNPLYRIGASTRSGPYTEYNSEIFPSSGTWTHICGVWNGGFTQASVKIYVNGVLLTEAASAGASANAPVDDSSFNWLIGNNAGSLANYRFKGLMDDVMVYGRALSDSEVSGLYYTQGGASEFADPYRPPTGLVGWWKFDELGGSTPKDSSPNNNPGTIKGPVAYAPGRIGNSLYFKGATGSNSYVDMGSAASLDDISPMTVCAWIKPDLTQSYSGVGVVDKGNSGGGPNTIGFTMYYEDTGGMSTNADNVDKGSTTGVSPGAWHHICTTWTGGTTAASVNQYADGALLPVSFSAAGGPNASDASYNFYVGALGGILKENFFRGYIDDVMYFNRVLSATEISDLYTRDGTIPGTGTTSGTNTYSSSDFLGCTAAGAGPFSKVYEATGATDYAFWTDGNYIYSAGSTVSALSVAGDGVVTRIDSNAFGESGFTDIWGNGSYIYALTSGKIRALQFNGTTLSSVASVTTGGSGNLSVWGDGTYIYVATGNGGLEAYTFDGASFSLKGVFLRTVSHVWGDGTYLYVSGNNSSFYVLTFDGTNFNQIASDDAGTVTQSWGDGNYIYTNANGLIAYSFNGTSLTQITSIATDLTGIRIWGDGQNIFVGSSTGVVRDYSFDGTSFNLLANTTLTGAIKNIWSDGGYLYIGENNKGAQLFTGFECGTSPAPKSNLFTAFDRDRGKVGAGETTSCAIKPNGSLWCWGDDTNGQLGNGSVITTTQDTMSLVSSTAGWRSVAVGDARACGITNPGLSFCWGDDTSGALGNGATAGVQQSPSAVNGGRFYTKLAMSYAGGGCGTINTGQLYCWGSDGNGQIGNGATSGNQVSPVVISVSGPWVEVSAGRSSPCAITKDGILWCWGRNNMGQIGNGTTGANVVSPTQVGEPGPWRRVSTGNYTACAIKEDGTLWCWGDGADGMLGSGAVEGAVTIPKRVADPGPWVDVALSRGFNAAVALKADGTIWSWGLNSYYRLGQPTLNAQYLVPTQIKDPGPWTAISMGDSHACGMKLDQSVWCWGRDNVGQLGNGSVLTADTATPGPVLNFTKETPFTWDSTGTILTSSGSGHYLVGTTSGISFDGLNGTNWSNGLTFPGSGRAGLRQDSGNLEYLIETGFATGSTLLSWKTATAANTRSMGLNYSSQNFVIGVNNAGLTLDMPTLSSTQLAVDPDGFVGIKGVTAPKARLDVNGGVRIGFDGMECLPTRKGTLRYVGGTAPFEYCNGTVWTTF